MLAVIFFNFLCNLLAVSFGLPCGLGEFNPNTEICCPQFFDVPPQNFSVFAKTNAFLDCCGAAAVFDTRKEICCGDGRVTAKFQAAKETGCCGDIPFNTAVASCCAGGRDLNSAKGALFDPASQVCCSPNGEDKGGHVPIHVDKYRIRLANAYSGNIYYGRVQSGSECCGPYSMPKQSKNLSYNDTSRYICCTNLKTSTKSVERGNTCCNGQGYFRFVPEDSRVCCRNDRFEEVLGHGDSCCGMQAFFNSSQRCCNGQLSLWTSSRTIPHDCCGNQAYNPTADEGCCDGGNIIYDVKTQFCCKGQVYARLANITDVGQLTCCNGITRLKNAGVCCKRQTANNEDWFDSLTECSI